MLIVKVELHSAITGKVTEIARMTITNLGTGTKDRGNYIARAFRKGSWATNREARVNDYPRLRLHVWNLVQRSLTAMGYK